MPFANRFLTIRRDPHSAEVLARGGDDEARSILERAGFVPVVRVHERYHRVPTDLSADEEGLLATEAVAMLRSAGYRVDCDEAFHTDSRRSRYLSLGTSVACLAEHIRKAYTTDEVAGIVTELITPHDGVLAALDDVLTALAEFHDGLTEPSAPYAARRLRHLADEYLHVIGTDLVQTRNDLADRHIPHPGRSTCAAEVSADERERSAVCSCLPPARTVPTPPAPPVAAGPRR